MQALLEQFGYLAVFALLLVGGLGVPVPEELTQLTAGVLAHEGIFELRIAVPVIWLGILAGDAVLFTLARRHGPRLLETRAARWALTPSRRAFLQRHYARHAFLTVFVARHAGGVRFPAFALAALSGVRFATFFLADALSALVSVPLVVGAGYLFWDHVSKAKKEIRIVELTILGVAAVVFGVVTVVRKRRRAAAAARGDFPAAHERGTT